MDEINYRRLISLDKERCEQCGATCYEDPDKIFRCVVCDHERFETCLDCGFLVGWCECAPVVPKPPSKKKIPRAQAGARTKK